MCCWFEYDYMYLYDSFFLEDEENNRTVSTASMYPADGNRIVKQLTSYKYKSKAKLLRKLPKDMGHCLKMINGPLDYKNKISLHQNLSDLGQCHTTKQLTFELSFQIL